MLVTLIFGSCCYPFGGGERSKMAETKSAMIPSITKLTHILVFVLELF